MRCSISCVRGLVATALVLCAAASPARAQCAPYRLTAPDGAADDPLFGAAVAVDGDTLIVGASIDDVGANAEQGSAHVYRWNGAMWVFEATLTASDGAGGDFFGFSVALAGHTALVGAPGDDVGMNPDQGSAYVFTRSPGARAAWIQQAKLVAGDAAANDSFGGSVAVSGDTAVVGAWEDDVGGNFDQGSAYVFTRSGTVWTQQAQLIASDGEGADRFGVNVAISGDTAIVGALYDDVGDVVDQGSAYVFTRVGTVWKEQARLTASDGATGDFLGISVALSGDTAIVGALGTNAYQGSAYAFTRSGTVWNQQAKITAPDGAANDWFGYSVSLSGDTSVVGAQYDEVGQGSAWVFHRRNGLWRAPADANGDGSVDMDDIMSVLMNFGADYSSGSGPGDADGNSLVNFADVLSVLANFGAVCP